MGVVADLAPVHPARANGNGAHRRLVEVVGPAGTGKSTLTKLLRRSIPDLRSGPGLWSVPRMPLLTNTVRMLPKVAASYGSFSRRIWEDIKQIIRLDTLYSVVRTPNGAKGSILIDEGPVLALGWFNVYGEDAQRPSGYRAWRELMFQRWGNALDVIIRLDAPDPILVHRIQERNKPHGMKEQPFEEVLAFVRRYRACLDAVIAELERYGRLQVIRVNTGENLPPACAALVQAGFDRLNNGH